jgi:2-polyprenyl-3-methyl-5-hydroxy-6-metoxy-1,4-benzoquinol methylase
MDRAQLPNQEEEKKKYDQHQNSPEDQGYRHFLKPAMQAVLDLNLPNGAKGLDYGCGPGPTLSVMLAERGYEVDLYDPIYQPDQTNLQADYAFVTCTEVVEHFHDVKAELDKLWQRVRHGGVSVIMTLMFEDSQDFESSHYHRDLTHVSFFSQATMQWWAAQHNAKIDFPFANVTRVYKD